MSSVQPKVAIQENNRGSHRHWHCESSNPQLTDRLAETSLAFEKSILEARQISESCEIGLASEEANACEEIGGIIAELEEAAAQLRELVAGQSSSDPVEQAILDACADASTENACYDSCPAQPEQYDTVICGGGWLVHVEHNVLRSIPNLKAREQCALHTTYYSS
ncbi:MAG: hypothetical protein Q7S68_04835 [Deltaproteobacteria bacterium]|nr:hypothetical protein [Deltaproteobacteria bacterium]